MKKYILLLLAMISLPIFGQVADQDKVGIEIFYSPNVSYRTLSDSRITDIRNESEQIKFGFSFGAVFRYRFNKIIGIESGLQFQSRGFQTKIESFEIMDPELLLPDKMKTVDRFYYLGLPAKLTIQKGINKISLISSIGIIGNILLYQDKLTILVFDDHTEKRITDYKDYYEQFILTAVASIGIDWRLSQEFKIMISPTFQHDITPILDAPLKAYL